MVFSAGSDVGGHQVVEAGGEVFDDRSPGIAELDAGEDLLPGPDGFVAEAAVVQAGDQREQPVGFGEVHVGPSMARRVLAASSAAQRAWSRIRAAVAGFTRCPSTSTRPSGETRPLGEPRGSALATWLTKLCSDDGSAPLRRHKSSPARTCSGS